MLDVPQAVAARAPSPSRHAITFSTTNPSSALAPPRSPSVTNAVSTSDSSSSNTTTIGTVNPCTRALPASHMCSRAVELAHKAGHVAQRKAWRSSMPGEQRRRAWNVVTHAAD